MARAYMTEKQMGREYWFFAVAQAAIMANQVPGRLGRKLTSPFELVHGVKPDSKTWFELFSVGYFNHSSGNDQSRSTTEDHSLDGIAVGRDTKTNTIIFYNTLTKSYYHPPAFRLDASRLPVMNFPQSVKYQGGLTYGLLRNRTDPVPEPFPPGTRVMITKDGDTSARGTIQRIPMPSSPLVGPTDATPSDRPYAYVVLLNDGTTVERTFEDLTSASPT
ncbi:hypothetical protein ACHAWF_009719, partial [Thalassiosira exigua]